MLKSKLATGSRWLDARPVRITALDARGPGLRGATAIAAVAVGATALGAVAIGRLAIGRAVSSGSRLTSSRSDGFALWIWRS
jgi:hypothetical protein